MKAEEGLDKAKEKIERFRDNLIIVGIPKNRVDSQLDFSKGGEVTGDLALPHNYTRNKILANHEEVKFIQGNL